MSGLATLLLAYVIGMAALATLWPLDFRLRPAHLIFETTVEDVVQNLGLLLPAGFLWRLAHPVRRAPACLDVLVLGLAVSATLEGLQLFLPSRVSSPTDVLMNGLGAWIGGGLYVGLKRRYRQRLFDRVCLALPLTKLLYVTVPLVGLQAWLRDWHALLDLLPLVLFTATIAAALQHRVGLESAGEGALRGEVGPGVFAASFSAAFGLAALPLWGHAPELGAALAAFAWVAAAAAFPLVRRGGARERRFEIASVRRALPWFVLYLAAIAWQPLGSSMEHGAEGSVRGMVLLRDVAAFTVLGYVLSQLYSRARPDTWRRRTLGWLVGCVAAFGVLRVAHGGSDLAESALVLASGLLGAAIHRSELRVIRALRAEASEPPNFGADGPSDPPPVPVRVPDSR